MRSLSDVLFVILLALGGISAICYGLYLIYHPLGWIGGGAAACLTAAAYHAGLNRAP